MSHEPPADGEVELTILGPGRGESCLVHVGRGEWLVVDSCVNESGQPAALAYLDSLGVPPSAVRWIVATHWHDDHVRGLANLVETCSAAKVIHSAALESDEFRILAAVGAESMVEGPSGVKELWRTWHHLADSGRSAPELARADYRVHHRKSGSAPECEIWALSPSGTALSLAVSEFSSLLASEGQPKRAVPRPKRNPSSVVVWVRVGAAVVLLGADLERSSDPSQGWQGIVGSTGRQTEKGHVVKVPHHGSEDAHDPAMWTDLLHPQPLAALTPFRQGNVALPRDADGTRIAQLASDAWLTHDTGPARAARRSRTVEKTIGEVTKRIERVSVNPGRVTFRCLAGDPSDWAVDAPSPAVRLG